MTLSSCIFQLINPPILRQVADERPALLIKTRLLSPAWNKQEFFRSPSIQFRFFRLFRILFCQPGFDKLQSVAGSPIGLIRTPTTN